MMMCGLYCVNSFIVLLFGLLYGLLVNFDIKVTHTPLARVKVSIDVTGGGGWGGGGLAILNPFSMMCFIDVGYTDSCSK